jgi:hypothetical protein
VGEGSSWSVKIRPFMIATPVPRSAGVTDPPFGVRPGGYPMPREAAEE